MGIEIAILVLVAAFLHAGWNALVKTAEDRLMVLASIALITSVAGALMIPHVAVPRPASWWAIGVSTLLHYLYYWFLFQTYRFGDLSQIYPLARGVAPVLVAIGAVVVSGETLSSWAIAGLAITSLGICSIAFFQDSALGKNPATLFFALGTGAVIAAYTVSDGVGVRLSGSPPGYIAWLFLFEFPVVLFAMARRRGRFAAFFRYGWRQALGTGLSSLVAYGLVIYAVAFAPMAAVSALRESSVIIAALIGTLVLRERHGLQRIAAAVMVASGVALITSG
ncbi:MAG: EamA family transporter [Deltaproteobacteria bacterium]|nr:EamA family transporter [Deltaproteobacteria bacterium]